MSDPREKDLPDLIKRDDPQATKLLFELYHRRLCSLAFRLVRDRDDAKDLVQNVFIKFWSNRKSLVVETSLSAYLRRSVVNAALNQIEKDSRYPKLKLDDASRPGFAHAADESYKYNELCEKLTQAIDRLPVRVRAIFLLIRYEEMSYKEAAETLGISIKAVEKDMMKALQLLREMLRDFLPMIAVGATFL